MYMDTDRWRMLMHIFNYSNSKEYGIYVTSQKAKLRGGYRRKWGLNDNPRLHNLLYL